MLVRRARRRILYNEVFSQGANAASVALLAFILLLLFGTQVLNWPWLVSVPLCAAAWAFYRVRERLPSTYRVAQILDDRLRLADTLSTAQFFSENPAPSQWSEEICRLQYERADRLAKSVDVRKAIPFLMPRAAYAMAALLLVASSLFALRYGLNRRLDLRPPLARILNQVFAREEKVEEARNHPKKTPPEAEPQYEGEESAPDREQSSSDHSQDSAANTEESNDGQPRDGDSQKSATDSKKQGDENGESESDQNNGDGDDHSDNGEGASDQQGFALSDQKQDSGNRQDGNNSGENSSLMNKLKDAFQNLISRVKPQPNQPGNQPSSGQQKGGQSQTGRQNLAKAQGKDGQPQNDGQQGEAQEGEAGEQAQNSQDPQGKGNGKSDARQANKQPGNGIGSHDGDKRIREAEQLAAMGKISEILGKRSATISGEATVEVQSTSQQLHTPYAQRGSQHSQTGAEISRDEIPVALQTFVEQYFEYVRKAPAAVKK
jgi:hypothetical protein